MELHTAKEILAAIESTSLTSLKEDLIRLAVRYARIRTDWYFMDRENRQEADVMRTAAHDALIDACNILSRNMNKVGEDNGWYGLMQHDRKEIGDFACHLHALLGIRMR